MSDVASIPTLRFVEKKVVREDRGLLPFPDPLKKFPDYYSEVFRVYEDAAEHLPSWLYSGVARKKLEELPPLTVEHLGDAPALLAFRMLSFAVSAYAWADSAHDIDAPQASHIPQNLAKPFVVLAKRLGIPPILSYFFYAMYNFRMIDSTKPLEFSNLYVLEHFTVRPFDQDESGFILPHVEIEAEAGPGLVAIAHAQQAVANEQLFSFVNACWTMHASLQQMIETLSMIPDVCSPDVYFKHVRPWIFYFHNIHYEGVGFFPLLKGETGAESAAIFSFDRALRIRHKETDLMYHLEEVRKYRPVRHAAWLRAIERGPSLKRFAKKHRDNRATRDAFNAVHDALVEFRLRHYNTALLYIKDKGRGAVATGGTHYEKFLSQLIRETEENKI